MAMVLSRLRLRLTRGFALAFGIGLAVLAAVALGYLWRESVRRLDVRLRSVATGVGSALEREVLETPDSSLVYAAAETVAEWPLNDDSFAILDERGAIIAVADRASSIDSAMAAFARATSNGVMRFSSGARDFRGVASAVATLNNAGRSWRYRVLSYQSTEGIEHDAEVLLGALALLAPLIVLVSLVGGYLLARRALVPMNELRASIANVAPSSLDQRIPVVEPRDEIGGLAAEFNALLDRLAAAQRQNRRFIREAAHQIRTPLTLVLGEAGHELSVDETTVPRLRAALARIRTAAEQMTHRVDDLFLLAEAQAGEAVKLGDDVELDGLVLECTDLMRARASALGRTLAIGNASPALVRGNATLLREAVLELIENGCKYGDAAVPIVVSASVADTSARIEVESAGKPFSLPAPDVTPSSGMGLPIVQWIAKAHHGEVRVTRSGTRNVVSIVIPA